MAFLGIKIPDDLASLLHSINVPGTKEDVDNLHITFLYFSQEALEPEEIGKILNITASVLEQTEPFFISFETISSFPKNDEGFPIILPIISKNLQKIHTSMTKLFDKNEIEFSKKFKEFKPHITLSYSPKNIKSIQIPKLGFTVTEFILWGGGRGENGIQATFPLKIKSKAEEKLWQLNKMAENIMWT